MSLRARLASRKHTVLLVVALLAEALQPMAQRPMLAVLFDFLVALLMLVVFLVVLEGTRAQIIGLSLGVPGLATNWLH
jgi:hypothetical protein